ncbi:LysR family transcriptional regulator [Pseudomonas oryzihabitans]|uniref:LysR family transcriptional regulator n=1 Tax=Pseudomonas oryzihabitans TaxID=47885 RepID=A0A0U4W081_9PSED|nr:LysR family transcriptional regulator [Pseudomonas oryzihabitans]ALZ83142.1 LysR family transcriptional regulator [Pseudomonas oryzihabitans]
MDSLTSLVAFVKTADALSFVNAGQAMGISASAVGKNVAKLEASLQVRLFHRSTRKVSLTPEGALFYERCKRALDELEDARALLSQAARTPQGRLKVSLPTIGYRFLLPHLALFRQHYPEIELELDFNDELVDVIDAGFDVVIRSGGLADNKLMARRLGPFRFVLCAAPDYLQRRGHPIALADLERHDCLRYRFVTTGKIMDWSLSADPLLSRLHLPTTLVLNNMEAILMAAQDGHGIAFMPDFLVREALAAGRLETLLDAYTQDEGQFWALWPSSRHLSPKVRVFVDFIEQRLFKAAIRVNPTPGAT